MGYAVSWGVDDFIAGLKTGRYYLKPEEEQWAQDLMKSGHDAGTIEQKARSEIYKEIMQLKPYFFKLLEKNKGLREDATVNSQDPDWQSVFAALGSDRVLPIPSFDLSATPDEIMVRMLEDLDTKGEVDWEDFLGGYGRRMSGAAVDNAGMALEENGYIERRKMPVNSGLSGVLENVLGTVFFKEAQKADYKIVVSLSQEGRKFLANLRDENPQVAPRPDPHLT
ncbi:MAG: hypothetical protein LRZ85_09215 [Alphaproteobacteria bacterium]|nr:hypothetical protein [Alphaproteobacteria bacterium]